MTWILIGVKNRVRIFYSSQLFGINEGIELADGRLHRLIITVCLTS